MRKGADKQLVVITINDATSFKRQLQPRFLAGNMKLLTPPSPHLHGITGSFCPLKLHSSALVHKQSLEQSSS